MVIGHNLPAMFVHLNMRKNDRLIAASMQRLGSGYRINQAKDDPAGSNISNKLSFQISGVNRASENSMNGISMVQVAEGAMSEIHNILQRMRELAVQAANDTNTVEDREKMQVEIDELTDEITAMAKKTEFNKLKVLNGEAMRVSNSSMTVPGMSVLATEHFMEALYISGEMASGVLSYEINSVSTSAVFSGDMVDITTMPLTAGAININGMLINFDPTDTFEDIQNKLFTVCSKLSIEVDVVENSATERTLTFTTWARGKQYGIDIQGSAEWLTFLGIDDPATMYSAGTDIELSNLRLVDANNNHIQVFDANRVISTNGNFVTITAINGQEIKLHFQSEALEYGIVPVDPEDPSYDPLDPATHFTSIWIDDGTGVLTVHGQLKIESYGPIMLQIGPNYNQAMSVEIPAITAKVLELVEYVDNKMERLLDYRTVEGAWDAIDRTDRAIQFVSKIRSKLGAYQNRLEQTIRSLDVTSENMEMARSRIRDTDMAKEMTDYTKRNVVFQAGLAILGQANQRPQQMLTLLA